MIRESKNEVRLKAPAKINLTLDLISKRRDGYHNILSVMQTISLFDDIIIRKTSNPGINVFCNDAYLSNNKNNLVYKITQDILDEYKITSGVSIKLFKRIPVGAGLGGGSSDCATALKGLIELFKLNITKYGALRMCKKYGMDVPFFYMGGTVLVSGTGCTLKKISDHPRVGVLLVKPKYSLITSEIFNLVKPRDFNSKYLRTPKIIDAINKKNIKWISRDFYNGLENVVSRSYPEIIDLKKSVLESGALGSGMTGSGPTVFGYFEDFQKARKAAESLKSKFNNIETFVTKTINED